MTMHWDEVRISVQSPDGTEIVFEASASVEGCGLSMRIVEQPPVSQTRLRSTMLPPDDGDDWE